MAKLSQIIEPFATALGLPARSMNVLAMVLRKGGLITKGGRGPAGAEMQSSDATNLLLAAMIGGEATSADKWVNRVRTARRQGHGLHDGKLPTVGFMRDTLGETLDALFSEMMSEGGLINLESKLPITNIALTVNQPSEFNCSADLWIDDGDTDGTLRFHRNGEVFDGIDVSTLSDEQKREIFSKIRRPRMHVTTSVGLDELSELAEIIGGPFEEEME
ncbi:hypothetical protein EJV44_08930 [Ancylobacter aquaticus]|nr:hypothetical protein EJV44_08930 [Ancylobacter aquaticus]